MDTKKRDNTVINELIITNKKAKRGLCMNNIFNFAELDFDTNSNELTRKIEF